MLTNVTNPRSQVVRRGLYEKTLIRRGATIGAGSTITKSTPDNALTLERAKQKSVEGWIRPVKKEVK